MVLNFVKCNQPFVDRKTCLYLPKIITIDKKFQSYVVSNKHEGQSN